MSDQPQPDNVNDTRPTASAGPALSELGKRGATRRRLGKAGIGAAGVFWTLDSKATGFACRTPSGFYSSKIHNSATAPKTMCEGWPPSVWCYIGSYYWPRSCGSDVMFASIFPCTTSGTRACYGKATMLQVLKGLSGDKDRLGAELAAAYLNVLTDKVKMIDASDLTNMWKQIQAGGAYKVSSTVFLAWKDLADFLKQTHY
ncbi:hypothetical protein LQ564_24005 [Massilia sp. G4R7]|uniref:Uncharacterized protein n=1 Tax=Massilia phyllostachyos TaxID=2898585 RepID=A0ABS8QC77_9BURK|nr:hypothetical protein [Massilia phyllostachyos]MCD2519371.1 hypothetical protein [Massilia phyllostachyos]